MRIQLLSAALFWSTALFSQSMEKGKLVAEVGAGFAFYKTTSTVHDTGASDRDTAGAFVFPITVDYGLHRMFAIGGTFKYSNYIEGDSADTEAVHGFDLCARPSFHFVNKDKFNMNLFALVGGTYLAYNSNDNNEVKGKGTGLVFGGGLDMRIFFSDAIGMYLSYNYVSFAYPNFVLTSPYGEYKVDYSLGGSNFGLGITFKIN